MAKNRRIVRKYKPATRATFDDYQWPVNMALVVLGGFLVGSILAYQRFDDPRWYASPWISMLLVGMLIFSSMLTLGYTANRVLRRTMQFSIVICAILHLLLLVLSLENTIFSRSWTEEVAHRDLMQKKEVTVAQRHPLRVNRPTKDLDIDRPVETKEPEPVPREIDRPEPEPQKTPLPPQPRPVEKPQEAKPEVVQQRAEQAPVVPRMSEQASKLSRHQAETVTASQQAVAVPVQPRQQPSTRPSMQSSSQQTARAETSATVRRNVQPVQPASEPRQQASNVQRTESQQQAVTETASRTSTPQSRQEVNNQPRTQVVPVPQEQAVARNTPEPAPTPRNTLARQETTRTNQAKPQPEPVVQTSQQPRQQPTPQQPTPREVTMARTPKPVENLERRITQRENITPSEALPVTQQTEPTEQPRSLEAVARTAPARTTSESTERAVTANVPATQQADPQPTEVQRSEVQKTATATQETQLSRQQIVNNVATTKVSREVPSNVGTASAEPSKLQASAVNLERQAAQATSSRRTVENVTQADQASTSIPNPLTNATRARTSNEAANPAAEAARASTNSTQRQTASTAIDSGHRVESVEAPQPRAQSQLGSVNASNVQVNRSNNNDAAARAQVAAADSPSTSSMTQQSVVAAARAQQDAQPAISRSGENQVQRSQQVAESARSPSTVERPNTAGSVTATPNNTPSRPAAQALSRATTGIAGEGSSANFDKSIAAVSTAEANPAAAAQHERATTQPGNAASPSETAALPRSQAEGQQPEATRTPNVQQLANSVAAEQATDQTIDAAASVMRASAAADIAESATSPGEVQLDTGPQQVVSEQQVGRASGGGQPKVNLQATADPLSRSPAGMRSPSLASTDVAELAAAPEAEAGTQAAARAMDAGRVTVERQVASANQDPTGAPVNAPEKGDPQAVSGDAVARAELKQASLQKAGQAGSPDDVLREQSLGRTAGSSLAQRQAEGLNAPQVTTEVAAPAPTEGETDMSETGGSLQAAASQLARAEDAKPAQNVSGKSAPQPEMLTGAAEGDPVQSTPLPRAEAVDAASGQPRLGGGNALARQEAGSASLAANNRAMVIEVAGAEASAGVETGTPLDTEGTTGRVASGTPGIPLERPVGASAGELAAPGSSSANGPVLGRAEKLSGNAEGPTLTVADAPGGSLGRQQLGAEASGAVGADIEVPEVGAPGESTVAIDEPGGGYQVGPVARQAVDGLKVTADALEGTGGLGDEFSQEIGIADRRAREDSTDVQLKAARFVKKGLAGLPSMNAVAEVARESFKGRTSREGGGRGAPPPQTEEAIELGLAFLARYQKEEGHWSLDQFTRLDTRPTMVSDSAATGLAVMAFQGAGYTHTQFKYKDALRAAIDFLVKHQDESGEYYFEQGNAANQAVRLYSHAIVTLALCESYGMTQDPDLRDSVQKGLEFIVKAQHPDRGGWRYTPGRDSDTSVSGWMVTALESGRRAGLEVSDEAMQKATSWLDKAQDPDQEYLFRYNPFAPDTTKESHGRTASKTMTSVGLLMRLYRGWKVSDPRAIEGAEYLKRHLPSIGRSRSGTQRDTYYWYYATQFMFHMGGDYWEAWNDRLYPLLLNTQITRGDLAGSWDPRLPVPDRWGPQAGRIYITTMNLLSLEIQYRYLPLYDEKPFQPEVAADANE